MNTFSIKPQTSEKLKAKQYGAAAFVCLFIAAALFAVRFFWGRMLLSLGNEQVPLEMLLPQSIILCFGRKTGKSPWKMTMSAFFLTGKAESVPR